jgi:hypothetical protein
MSKSSNQDYYNESVGTEEREISIEEASEFGVKVEFDRDDIE